jgi:threonine/homoserine/homoserine lactone efflux protein
MTWSEMLWLAGVLVLGQFSPGPDLLLVTHTALHRGRRDGLRLALGIGCGLMAHAAVAVSGMSVVFLRLPAFGAALRWLAAGYLLWLAYGLLAARLRGRRDEAADATPRWGGGGPPFVRGLLCNLLNPKAALFFAAVCTPFLGDPPAMERAVAVWLMIVGLGTGLWCLWVLALQWPPLRGLYFRAVVWIDVAFAILLGALAVGLLIGG